ncbi:MAG: LemA family protein [Candidatus Pacebacteria bacterium]|nr:LemA family protein [Candidatus Paceibacterota bacterium]
MDTNVILIVLLVIVVAVTLWFVMIYNALVKLKVRTNEAWSDIDVQLKRRYDLIPNLINTVKGYATHEKELFEKVTQARANAMNAQNPEEQAGAENMLTGALKSLFAVSEAYPDLKANTNFLELQRELSDTENKIQASRRFYNGNVRDLNTKIQIFPDSIVAGILNIKKREFFEIDEPKEKETPKVEF